jgi:predicted nuclease of restriction endonuclease-like RecB superfamily
MTTKKSKTRNKFEQDIERSLKRKRAKFKYECEKIPYIISGHYIPDFVIETPLGKIYVEAKGYLRPEHKRKMVAVKKCNPQLDLRILFYADKKKDNKWAEKNGFRYAIKTIPSEWLLGL